MHYPIFFKKFVHNTLYSLHKIISNNYIQLDWSKSLNNFGDILNPIIVGHISSKKIINVRSNYCYTEHLQAIGSILNRATKNSIVWGSGFISESSNFISTPKKIYAVRGPQTRKILLQSGVECPEIYGDPALLMPRFYKPTTIKKYRLGIIPHYVDKDSYLLSNLPPEIKLIDVQNPNPLQVIDEICECENIASSSLHGLIVSEAYNIPTVWIRFSDKIEGGDFKFFDYYSSIGYENPIPLVLNRKINRDELIGKCEKKELKIDLNLLQDSFPPDYK